MQIYVYRLIWIVCATTGNIYATDENVSVDDTPRGGKKRNLKVENFLASICLRIYAMALIPFVCLEMLEQACKLYNTSPRDISYIFLKLGCAKLLVSKSSMYTYVYTAFRQAMIWFIISQTRLGLESIFLLRWWAIHWNIIIGR